MKLSGFFFLLFVYLNSFSQSLIGIGSGVGIMNIRQGEKKFITQQNQFPPIVKLSFCGMKETHFYMEVDVDFTKHSLVYDYKTSMISPSSSGYSDGKIEYDIILSHISLLLQFRSNLNKTKLYFGGGIFYTQNFSAYTGYEIHSGVSVFAYSYDSTYINSAKITYGFLDFALNSGLDIPVTERIFLSLNIIYRGGFFDFRHLNYDYANPYRYSEGYFSISLRYKIHSLTIFKCLKEKIKNNMQKE